MSGIDLLTREYVLGDRMGELEEGLADALMVDCSLETYPAAGPVLWSDGKSMAMDTGAAHTMIVSGTGSGKTVSEVLPMLRASIKAGESLFVTDVKAGELYEGAWPYLRQQGYSVCLINLRQPLRGGRYDPLALPFQLILSPKAETAALGHQLLAQAADALIMQEGKKDDPFWDNSARDTFLGLAYLCAARGIPENTGRLQAIQSCFSALQSGDKPLIERTFLDAQTKNRALADTARRLMQPWLLSKDSPRTLASINSVLAGKFNRLLGTPLQDDLLSGSDLNFAILDESRVAVFLLLPDETDIWSAHAALLTTQVYQYLCLLAGEHPGGRLPHRFHFLLEEFGNLALGNNAVSLFSAGRSRNIRVTAVVQSFSQLQQRYGREVADTIRYNCNNWIYLYTRDLETLHILSELCGTRSFPQENATRPVASVADLQRIKQGQALIFQARKHPYLTRLSPIWDYPETAPAAAAHYPIRELRTDRNGGMWEGIPKDYTL